MRKGMWVIACVVLGVLVEAKVAQTPVVTMKLDKDEIGIVKTGPGITTRLSFFEEPVEMICGDSYDPNSGTGTFVVQRSGNEVFLKPIVSKGESNLFVKTGANGERIYNFNLVIVPSAHAYRIVNVISTQPAPVAAKKRIRQKATVLPAIASIIPIPPISAVESAGASVNHRLEELPPSPALSKPQPDIDDAGSLRRDAVKRVTPDYPELARATGTYGEVVVEVVINEKGTVVSAEAVSGPLLLRIPAILAAKLWKFEEAKPGDAVGYQIGRITFNFHSSDNRADGFYMMNGGGSGSRGRRN